MGLDDANEFFFRLRVRGLQTGLNHRADGIMAGQFGEIGRGKKRVVDVKEDGLDGGKRFDISKGNFPGADHGKNLQMEVKKTMLNIK